MWQKRLLTSIAWFMCFLLTACAGLPVPPSSSAREEWGKLVIAPARFTPKSNIEAFAIGSGKGAAKGATAGAAEGVLATGAFAVSGPLEAIIAPYLLIVTVPVMAVTGAVLGHKAAISEEDAAAMDEVVQRNLADLKVSNTLARKVAEATQQDIGQSLSLVDKGPLNIKDEADYRPLTKDGVDTVMEVVVKELGFTGDKEMRFFMVARARVVRAHDNEPVYEREFVYLGDEYKIELWGKNHAALFEAELQRAYDSLTDSMVEQVLLLTTLPLSSKSKPVEGELQGFGYLDACGLAWVSPLHDYHPTITDKSHRRWNRYPKVDSLEPTLAWEPFPRDIDRRASKAINMADLAINLSDVSHVRYDLRVWRVTGDLPPTLVYEKRDLDDTSHTIQQTLQANTRYFWSVRARFNLGGRVQGTRWSYFRAPNYMLAGSGKVKPQASIGSALSGSVAGITPRDPCTLDFIPTTNYYRFKTPK